MALSIRSIKYLSRSFRRLTAKSYDIYNKMPSVEKQIFLYSTTSSKYYFDVFEIFTDILHFNRSRYVAQKPTPISTVTSSTSENDHLSNLSQKLTTMDVSSAARLLKSELGSNINHANWKNVDKILRVFVEKQIYMDDVEIIRLAKTFVDIGFKEGLNSLRSLCSITNSKMYLQEGEFLHYLARCNWVGGNVKECIRCIRECLEKYPHMNDGCKTLLKNIIFEAVSSRSEAELINVVDFVKKFTIESNDFYPVAVLWNYLFLSEWFTDQCMANTLLETISELQLCVTLMSPSIAQYLIRSNKINDVYRLLQVLLKYNIMESYAVTSQMMFDYYCLIGNRHACSEIVNSCAVLNVPLRDEQYNQFISWSVSGDPFKFIKKTEIEKIYSKF